jgi:hypothetical protein
VDAFQVAFLGGFPGDPFGDEFFSHYFSMGSGVFPACFSLVKTVVPDIFILPQTQENRRLEATKKPAATVQPEFSSQRLLPYDFNDTMKRRKKTSH